MPTLSTVVLTIKGDARKANITLNDTNEITIEQLQKYTKKKDIPEIVYESQINNKYVFLFGYKKGKKGTENKTKLPVSNLILYGDIIVIVSTTSKWSSPISFTVDQWNQLFDHNKEGVEEEEDEKEDEDEDDDDEEEIEGLEELSDQDSIGDEDDYLVSSDSEDESIIEKDEEIEEVAPPIKRKRAPVYKVDPNILKEEIDIESVPESNQIRMISLENFNFLKTTFSDEDIRSLEKSIFESTYQYAKKNYIVRNWKSPQFVEIYKQQFRSVISNIHPMSPVKNPRLLHRVIEGEFSLSAIPFMSSYEMYPEKWFELKDRLIQREQKILEGNKSRATDQFKCRRCNKRECTYYELQTRSADEPMTIFITCLNCGKEWRQG